MSGPIKRVTAWGDHELHRPGRRHLVDGHRQRPCIKALQRDPRATVVISSMGTDMGPGKQLTHKGRVRLHEDQATKTGSTRHGGDYFALSRAHGRGGDRLPGHPLRVIIELVPEQVIRFDGDKIAQASHEGSVPGAGA